MRPRTTWLLAFAVPVVLTVLAIGVVLAVTGDGGGGPPAAHGVGPGAPPLELASVPAGIADHYRHAAAHEDVYRQIPCYCGCEEFLDHRNLADCFVRANGGGWEAHAAGCGVCIGEAATAHRLLDQGSSPAEVRAAVIAQFGSTPPTTPPST